MNSTLKTVLTVVFLIAAYLFTHRGVGAPSGNGPSAPSINVSPSNPNIAIPEEPRASEQPTPPADPAVPRHTDAGQPSPKPHDSTTPSPKRDLDQDERDHGHTLARHVGRTDQQLIDRMKAESISSASTYTDKESAERTCALALIQHKAKIDAWIAEGANRDKLAFDYRGDGRTQIGRSIHRGSTQSVPCYDAKVVLIPRGNSFTVLTTYPEGR